jgi:hypothetical protein
MFHLKTPPNKDGSRLIYLQFNYHAIRLKLSTGLNIDPKYWDSKRERAKQSFKYYPQYNALLDKYDTVVNQSYLELRINGVPNMDTLKAEVLRRMEPAKVMTIYDYALKYVHNHATYKETTKQAFSRLAELIKEFDQRLTFEAVTLETMMEFRDFLLNKGFQQNTVSKIYQRFRTVLNDATDAGANQNLKYRTKKVSITPIDTTKVFLDQAELDSLAAVHLEGVEDLARDLFLISCYTGARYSDIWKINKSAFYREHGTPHFKIVDKKNDKPVSIPAHPSVLSIMAKYDWSIPSLSNATLNKNIKFAAEKAGIKRDVVVTSWPGAIRKDEVLPKYELITVHTGRRSLICNLYMAGMPVESIKQISGHRNHNAFLKYLRLTPKDHLEVAFKSTFFKTKLKKVK